MKLDLIALKNRCLRAQRRGWIVSSASQLVADLEEELGGKLALPRGVKAASPAHLVALIEALQAKPAVAHIPTIHTPEPVEPVVVEEPEPEEEMVEVELADEPEAEEGEELEALSYEEMSYQQLVDEAQDRGLPGRRGTSKVDLLEMLKQDDED